MPTSRLVVTLSAVWKCNIRREGLNWLEWFFNCTRHVCVDRAYLRQILYSFRHTFSQNFWLFLKTFISGDSSFAIQKKRQRPALYCRNFSTRGLVRRTISSDPFEWTEIAALFQGNQRHRTTVSRIWTGYARIKTSEYQRRSFHKIWSQVSAEFNFRQTETHRRRSRPSVNAVKRPEIFLTPVHTVSISLCITSFIPVNI